MSLIPVNGGWVYSLDERPKMELNASVGTIYGARYHTVEVVYGGDKWKEMEEWCTSAFGPVSSVWKSEKLIDNRRWYVNNSKFWFRNEEDRSWFMLRFE